MYKMNQISKMAGHIKSGLGDDARVFLFGSYAWGRPNVCSDIDFAVVVPDFAYNKKIAVTARKLSQHGLIPIDVVSYRSSTFDSSVAGTLSYEIRNKGVEL